MALSTFPFVFVPIVVYPAAFVSYLPPHPTPLAVAKIRECLSFIHCTVATLLSIYCLHHHSIFHLLSPQSLSPSTTPIRSANLPIITLKSALANAVTAYETGYIFADTLIVLYARHIHLIAKHSHLSPSDKRGLNLRHLLTHHIMLLIAFLLLQLYIVYDKERGILIIIVLMLQNFSSPFGTLRWFLSITVPRRKGSILFADVCYITTYAVCRVWLLYWIVARFAGLQGLSVLQGFRSLKWHCQFGTLGMGYINARWLIKITRRAVKQYSNQRLASQTEKKAD